MEELTKPLFDHKNTKLYVKIDFFSTSVCYNIGVKHGYQKYLNTYHTLI